VRHCDGSGFTILWQDDLGGLEIKNKSASDRRAADRRTFVINIGNILQRWSNGASRDRASVINRYGKDRYSIPSSPTELSHGDRPMSTRPRPTSRVHLRDTSTRTTSASTQRASQRRRIEIQLRPEGYMDLERRTSSFWKPRNGDLDRAASWQYRTDGAGLRRGAPTFTTFVRSAHAGETSATTASRLCAGTFDV